MTRPLSSSPSLPVRLLFPLLASLAVPTSSAAQEPGLSGARPNVLLLVADDVGVENVGCYAEGSDLPPTPNIDALSQSGILFRNTWSYALTSPSLAPIYTGRYGFRTGIGVVFSPTTVPDFGATAHPMQLSEFTLPELLDLGSSGYRHAMIGQWHLGNDTVGGIDAPLLAGFEYFEGHPTTIVPPETYFDHTEVKDGVVVPVQNYAPTEKVDDALAWIASVQDEPWFVSLVFHTAHTPFHEPPAELHTQELEGLDPKTSPREFFKADVEAMDTEIGRLLSSLGSELDDTVVIFLGDNGTDVSVTVPPFLPEHGKISLYEGGINVPLIISGPVVPAGARGAEVSGVTDLTDVFATVLELAGVDPLALVPPDVRIDGVSLVPYLSHPHQPSLRPFVVSEIFAPNGDGIPPDGVPQTKQAGDPPVCQPNLGYGGPGPAKLSICGETVTGENVTKVDVRFGPPNASCVLAIAYGENPTTVLGQTVAAWPPVASFSFSLDATGHAQIPLSAEGMTNLVYQKGLHSWNLPQLDFVAQVAVSDPAAPLGVTFTNAVKLEYLFERTIAIRDTRGFKLMLTDKGGPEHLFDLSADPWELNDLLSHGPLSPSSPAGGAYQALKTKVVELYQSEL